MADCTKCLYQRQINRLGEICRACAIGGEDCGVSHGGVSFVHFDAARETGTIQRRISPDYLRGGGTADKETLMTPCNDAERERYLRFMQMFAELNWDDAGLVAALLRGETIGAMAARRGVKYETMFLRWQKLCRNNPAFKALASPQMGLGRGRKKSNNKAKQGDLFD